MNQRKLLPNALIFLYHFNIYLGTSQGTSSWGNERLETNYFKFFDYRWFVKVLWFIFCSFCQMKRKRLISKRISQKIDNFWLLMDFVSSLPLHPILPQLVYLSEHPYHTAFWNLNELFEIRTWLNFQKCARKFG